MACVLHLAFGDHRSPAAFALAYLLNPLVKRIERCGVASPYAVLIALAVVALLAGAFLTFIIPELWNQAAAAGQLKT